MVAIPIRMYLATESKSISFRLLCPEHHEPIKNKRWCPATDHEIGWNDTVRGFEVSKGDFVELSDKDLESVPLKTAHTIDIVEFCDDSEIEAGVYIKSAYYLEPEAVGTKPYALLRKALNETGKVAIGKIAFRDREHLCRIALHENGLMMNTLHWPDEIRDAGELAMPSAEQMEQVEKREVEMAIMLINSLSATFDPERYRDEYRDAVLEVVEAKVNDQPIRVHETEETAGSVTDLMAVLKASVEAAASKKDGAAENATKTESHAKRRKAS
jgi:DNA end-binding protein Ku